MGASLLALAKSIYFIFEFYAVMGTPFVGL